MSRLPHLGSLGELSALLRQSCPSGDALASLSRPERALQRLTELLSDGRGNLNLAFGPWSKQASKQASKQGVLGHDWSFNALIHAPALSVFMLVEVLALRG